MSKDEYFKECLASSFDEHGVVVTKEQLDLIAADVTISHENIGMAFYQPENPLEAEVDKLSRALKIEQDKVVCKECWGGGRITEQGPCNSSNTDCWKCRGEGYVKP